MTDSNKNEGRRPPLAPYPQATLLPMLIGGLVLIVLGLLVVVRFT